MPKRLLIPSRWLARHIEQHPGRLTWTSLAVLIVSLGVLGYSIRAGWDRGHEGRVTNCQAINELSRKIYVTLADFGTPPHIRQKFLPSKHCEDIP